MLRCGVAYMSDNIIQTRLDALSVLSGYQMPPSVSGLRLDSNENLVIPVSVQKDILTESISRTDVRQYPLRDTDRLRQALAVYLDVPDVMVSVGNGSDQILDTLLRCLATGSSVVLATDPTFTFFVDRCALYDISMIRMPYSNDMTLDVNQILAMTDNVDILYLDSPNNPTGYQMPQDDLRRLADEFDGLIILDEAYADFGEYNGYPMVFDHPNMVSVRTLSKSFGLAGLRVGYMIADQKITGIFNRLLQYPYPMSSVSIESAILALERASEISASWNLIRSERRRVIQTLREYDVFRVFDSNANFVLFDAGSADDRMYKVLAEQQIQVRMLGRVGNCEGCIRVTLGTPKMNSRFLLAIRDLLK